MYMFDKHVHAYKHAETQYVIMRFLPPCTCLAFNSKKKFTYCLKYAITVGPLCLRCGSVVSPFHLRFRTVSPPFLRIGEKWDLQGRQKGLASNSRYYILKVCPNLIEIIEIIEILRFWGMYCENVQ